QYFSDIGFAAMTGSLTLTLKGTTAVSPEDLYSCSNSYYGSIQGRFTGASGSMNGDMYTRSIADYSNNISVAWGIYSQYIYTNSSIYPVPTGSWSADIGGSATFGVLFTQSVDGSEVKENVGYWRAKIDGAEWSEDSVSGPLSGDVMTHTWKGTITGEILGYAADGVSLEAAGAGVYEGILLSHAGTLEESGVFIVRDSPASGYFDVILGGTEDLWNADSVHAAADIMGSYVPVDTSSSTGGQVFQSYIASSNAFDGTHTTYAVTDGSASGAYKGFLTGVVFNGSAAAESLFKAIYIAPDGTAGYLTGTFAGNVYPDMGSPDNSTLNMIEMSGNITRTEMPFNGGIEPSELFDYLDGPDSKSSVIDASSWKVLGTDGYIRTYMVGEDASIDNSGWGIWRGVLLGDFEGAVLPSATGFQTPIIGKVYDGVINPEIGPLAYTVDDGTLSKSCFFGVINFTDWQDNSRVAGNINAIYIDHGHQGGSDISDDAVTLTCGSVKSDLVGANKSEFLDVEEKYKGTYDAESVGEWVEEKDLINNIDDLTKVVEDLASKMDITVETMRPDTLMGSGYGGIMGGQMDMAFYNQAGVTEGIWAAIISGVYSPSAIQPNGWGLTVGDQKGTVNLQGVSWQNNEWQATVNGTYDGKKLDGSASGTYTAPVDGATTAAFQGAGSGTFKPADGDIKQ
ncbi:MAG: hypothetical protein HQL28_06875, partial [Candidatus Omnitrophica bacterium]|nr:hypothetical protein [Candidatus Omnitrophota bacterium]